MKQVLNVALDQVAIREGQAQPIPAVPLLGPYLPIAPGDQVQRWTTGSAPARRPNSSRGTGRASASEGGGPSAVTHPIGTDRGAYLYLISGAATVAGHELATGDAVKVTDEPELPIEATTVSELILVDVPMTFERVGIWSMRR
jgi:hypothetical protein